MRLSERAQEVLDALGEARVGCVCGAREDVDYMRRRGLVFESSASFMLASFMLASLVSLFCEANARREKRLLRRLLGVFLRLCGACDAPSEEVREGDEENGDDAFSKEETPARRERPRYRAPSVLTNTACLSSALSSTPHGRKLTSASNGRSCCALAPFAPFPSALKLKPRVGEGYAVGGDARVANGEERIDDPRPREPPAFRCKRGARPRRRKVLAETEEAMGRRA